MRGFGILLLFVGLLAVIGAMSMDVSVGTGMGGRVNNLGLMADRQNYTIIGGFMSLAGLIMIALGGKKSGAPQVDIATTDDTRSCPMCAESIKLAAIRCKHCGAEVERTAPSAAVLDHGWTVRVPCRPAEVQVTESRLDKLGFPLQAADGPVVVVGYYDSRDSAKAAQAEIADKLRLHGDLYLPMMT